MSILARGIIELLRGLLILDHMYTLIIWIIWPRSAEILSLPDSEAIEFIVLTRRVERNRRYPYPISIHVAIIVEVSSVGGSNFGALRTVPASHG